MMKVNTPTYPQRLFVTYSVKLTTSVVVNTDDPAELEQVIEDILVPETVDTYYYDNSFEVVEVRDENDNKVNF